MKAGMPSSLALCHHVCLSRHGAVLVAAFGDLPVTLDRQAAQRANQQHDDRYGQRRPHGIQVALDEDVMKELLELVNDRCRNAGRDVQAALLGAANLKSALTGIG